MLKVTPNRRLPRLLVLGIGNILMSDDAVGVRAVEAIRKRPCSGVLVTEVGTSLLAAVPLLCWADRVLVIDALDAGAPPGALYFTNLRELKLESGAIAPHQLDLAGALAFMPPAIRKPEIFVLGVQPASIALGLSLSTSVAAAIPKIEDFVRRKLKSWKQERIAGEQVSHASFTNESPNVQ